MKDNRFQSLETPFLIAPKKKERRLSSFRAMLTEKAQDFIEKLDELSNRNKKKFKPDPLLYLCKYCKRNKFFPCTDPKHMTKKDGLCPDQICARIYRDLRGATDEPVESYPPYRS